MADRIPTKVREFIIKHIDSVAELEALLLLSKNPDNEWTSETLAERLYIEISEAERILQYFLSLELFQKTSAHGYAYRPANNNMDEHIKSLAATYSQYLVPVTHLIHSKSKSRIQEFADAFRLRKDTI